jgi:hypothetical protein
VLLLAMLLLAGCGGSSAPATTEVAPAALSPNTGTSSDAHGMAPAARSGAAAATRSPAGGASAGAKPGSAASGATQNQSSDAPADAAQSQAATPLPNDAPITGDANRKIIKNADLTVEAENVDIALSRIGTAAAQVGGYVLETRTDYPQANQKSAILKIAVPVDQFEATLERIRGSVKNVLSEQASGTDATQEFVDVQSQIANLEATQARIREFLKQATSVEESLRVNAQLTEIEGQISTLKGRMNFLSQRAAYSTISVEIRQLPLPMPTAVPTAVPTPQPVFNPSKTADQAFSTLTVIVQAVVTVGIWVVVLVLPLAVPLLLVAFIVRARRCGQCAPIEASGGSSGD